MPADEVELSRLVKLFKDHYNGSPWLDVTILATLEDVSALQAERRIGSHNSIWQIVRHMIAWRRANLQRIQGIIHHAPENNYIEDVADTSEQAWKAELKELEKSQKALLSYMTSGRDLHFDAVYAPNSLTYYEHIQAILQHDAYHLGQIVLLKKLLVESA